jgi:hypothetical protein
MASLEKRVARLEQQFLSFQEEAGRHIRETDEKTTITGTAPFLPLVLTWCAPSSTLTSLAMPMVQDR